MTMLADHVDVVIGVDTHKHTHTAAAVTPAGRALETITVSTDPDGYQELVELELACLARHEGEYAGPCPAENSAVAFRDGR